MWIKFVIKRDGRKEKFQQKKLIQGILGAAQEVGKAEEKTASVLALKVVTFLKQKFPRKKIFSSTEIGDIVEKVLIDQGLSEIAKAYILYRDEKREEHVKKLTLGVKDDLGLSYNALFLLQKRYLKRNEAGSILETPRQMLMRVARAIAKAEKKESLQKSWEEKFFQIMVNLQFLPGTRALANAGKKFQQTANCFVFPMGDSVEEIFQSLYESSLTKKFGGGCGFDFSPLRPKGDLVGGSPGLAAGPVKIIEFFDTASQIYRQEGDYESGNLIVLRVDHPDVLSFITCKEKDGYLPKTNISLGVTDKFMEAVQKDLSWELVNPRTQQVVNKIRARAIFELAANLAWQTGDPGMVFLDTINKDNPVLRGLGPITATNLCGEQPLYPYECCNLGYLDLPRFLTRTKSMGKSNIDYALLEKVIKIAVRLMDDMIDVAFFPVEEIARTVRNNRRIGIGIVGWAEFLARLEIPYDSEEAFSLAEEMMKFIHKQSFETSVALADEKGPFPNVKYSIWRRKKNKPRNVTLNTLPPSSNHAIILRTSFGIEPFFALVYSRRAMEGVRLFEVNSLLVEKLKEAGIYSEKIISEIGENHGSLQGILEIPKRLREIFKTAHDVHYRDHIKMQAAFQKWTDNAVSKTINLPHNCTPDDVEKVYFLAWKLGCKGITVYRDRSKQNQVIEFGANNG